jgi:hypothetical protein
LIHPFKLEHDDNFRLAAKDGEFAPSRRGRPNLNAVPPALGIGGAAEQL